jgi:hypothetical protein
VFQLLGEHRLSDKDIVEVDVVTSELAMRVLAFSEPATPYRPSTACLTALPLQWWIIRSG